VREHCYRDYAQTDGQQLMDLLTSIDADLERPDPADRASLSRSTTAQRSCPDR